MRKNSYKNFWLASLAFYNVLLYTKICYLCNFTTSVLHIQHTSFPNHKSWWKSRYMVKYQELKIVCRESNVLANVAL